MEKDLAPGRAGRPDPNAKAREILNRPGLSKYRVDPRTIKTTGSKPGVKGGQATVVVGTLIPPEEVSTWSPEQLPTYLLEERYAIKMLEWNREDPEESVKFFKSFVNELSLMAELSHCNIIQLEGFVEDMEKGDAWIVLPWEANGNVREFLQSGEWDIPERISLIQDVVNGVEYLHTREPPVCHGDLKSLNILVNSSYHAVITDFGSARRKPSADEKEHHLSEKSCGAATDEIVEALISPHIKLNSVTLELTLTGPGFSLRWTAPEVLDDGVQDLPSDIWAVGWICWEIVTGKMPFEELHKESSIVTRVVRGELPAIREQAQLSHVLQLCGLMSDCWVSKPTERTDASTLRRVLDLMPSIPPSTSHAGRRKVRSAELLLQLGEMYRRQDDGARAESQFRSALQVASQTHNSMTEASALNGLGSIYRTQSRYKEAEEALRKAHEIHSRIGNDMGTANTLDGLGHIYREQSRYQEAEEAFRKANEIHFLIGDNMGAANALLGLGSLYLLQSRNPEADEALRKAHEIHSRIGNDLGTANALLGLGSIYRAQSRYQEAEETLRKTHEIHSRIGNDLGTANALDGLGEIYRAQSRSREAEKAFSKAHEIHSRIGNDMGTANALNGLGSIYRVQSRYKEAKEALRKAHEIYSRIDDEVGTANALYGLGHIYREQSRNGEAEVAFRKAHVIHSHMGNDLGTANALHGLGLIYRAESRYKEAAEALKKAHEILSRIGNRVGVASALHALGEVYRAESRSREAEEVLREAHGISSSLDEPLSMGNSLRSLGVLFTEQRQYEAAQSLFCQALSAYNRAGECFSRAKTLLLLAEIYRFRGNHLQEEESLTEALTIGVRLEHDGLQGPSLALLAKIFRSQSRYSVTLAAPLQTGPTSERTSVDIRRGAALHDLGRGFLVQSKYRQAEDSYSLALALFSRAGDRRGEASAFRSIGTLFTLQAQLETGAKRFAQARSISVSIFDHDGELMALGCLMGACLLQGKLAALRSYCMEALKIYYSTQWSTNHVSSPSSGTPQGS